MRDGSHILGLGWVLLHSNGADRVCVQERHGCKCSVHWHAEWLRCAQYHLLPPSGTCSRQCPRTSLHHQPPAEYGNVYQSSLFALSRFVFIGPLDQGVGTDVTTAFDAGYGAAEQLFITPAPGEVPQSRLAFTFPFRAGRLRLGP